ncbi:site-specific DNA-methyltransferase [Priestia flexa]|uniref:site-specific DNA-methyltransferase n=1 Tax=Priestia flexa TaxID=86664 RepID=UPI001EF46E19|nr:site-specific DNA-methyltransferase [Priestia flexa]
MSEHNEELNKKSVEEIQEETRNERWEELKGYYPQFFDKEGNFEFEKFKCFLTDSDISVTMDGFSLNFVGKEYAKLLIDTPTDTLVSPNEKENDQGVNKDSKNIYIIGDNIDVLKHLRKSYTNSIDAIYIDPPYNTGSDDFTYPDTFQFSIEKLIEIFDDEEKAERIYNLAGKSSHSAWLTFMLPRITIAHKLLKKEGVMFVSLDDNEASNMTLLCDEIFGENNRLGPIIHNKQNSKNDTKNIQKNHDYVLVYRKSAIFEDGKEKENIRVISRQKQEVFEENGEFYYFNDYITTRGEGGTLANRKNLGYTVYFNRETNDMIPKMDYDKDMIGIAKSYEELYTNDEELISNGYYPIRPPKVRNQFGVWTWEMDKFVRDKKMVKVTGSEPNYNIKKRTFVDSSEVFEEDGKYYIERDVSSNSRSILDFSTNDGTTYFNELMGAAEIFTNPKNVDLLQYLLDLIPQKEDILVLDFFSGSATTADAVMRLNANDKGVNEHIISDSLFHFNPGKNL